jgi:DNA recombination protein RmuC
MSLFLAALAGAAICYAILAARRSTVDGEASAKLASAETELRLAREERARAADAEAASRARLIELEKSLSSEAAQRKAVEARLDSQKDDFEKGRALLREQMENLSQKLLRDTTKQLQESSEKNLQTVLAPLREKLTEFQKQVGEAYSNESRERLSLQREIERIVAANEQMSKETGDLTRALKGDSKTQGDWGEFILEGVLESSGLRKGEEYITQGEDLGLRDEEGRVQKPDIVIKLPDEKHLIIDSKVSLPSYEQYLNAPTEEAAAGVLKDLHTSIYKHVDGLAGKHYAAQQKLRSPDFVFMFLPTEALFATTLRTDKAVFNYALERRVYLVSPTTLMAVLKAVASVWKSERQNKNALEIARHAGMLYDRFVSLLDSLDKVGSSLGTARKSFDAAIEEINDPSRGIARKIEDLRELGAKAKRKIDQKYLPDSEPESPRKKDMPPGVISGDVTPAEKP